MKGNKKLDETVFEHRNREYGAYHLRNIYNSVMTKAIMITVPVYVLLWLAVLLFYVTEEMNFSKKPVWFDVTGNDKMDFYLPPPPKTKNEKTDLTREIKHSIIKQLKIVPVNPTDANGKTENSAIKKPEAINDETKIDPQKELINKDTLKEENTNNHSNDNYLMIILEKLPTFPGGDVARVNFIRYNTEYPKEDWEKGIQGIVIITFIVETDGSLTGISILKGLSPSINREAMKIVQKMPKWNPGIQHGKPVRVAVNLPVRFTLK